MRFFATFEGLAGIVARRTNWPTQWGIKAYGFGSAVHMIQKLQQNCVACHLGIGTNLVIQMRQEQLPLLFVLLRIVINNGNSGAVVLSTA